MKTLKVWCGCFSEGNKVCEWNKINDPIHSHVNQGKLLISAYTKKQAMSMVPTLKYNDLTNYFSETGNRFELDFCKGKVGAWLFPLDFNYENLKEKLIFTYHEEEVSCTH